MSMKPRLNDQFGDIRGTVSSAKKVNEFGNIPRTVSDLKPQPIDPDHKIPGTETPEPKK
jgi:hypothetical protein